ncbi:MAG: cyclase family protein [Candidatus Thorarchaeota archaeon]
MKIYDISSSIHPQMSVYPGDPPPRFRTLVFPAETSSARMTWIEFNSHTGTHVDAAAHLFPDGQTIDLMSLSSLIGDAEVVMFNDPEHMYPDYYKETIPLRDTILLLKTSVNNSRVTGGGNLSPEVIRFFIQQGIKAIGIDTLSIEGVAHSGLMNHRLLLKARIPIIEGLVLNHVPFGHYFCVCLPLKFKGLDGAPSRCVLIRF